MALPQFKDFEYLVTTEYPTKIFNYSAMKNGAVKVFDKYSDAQKFSPLVEKLWVNKDAYHEQLDAYRTQYTAQVIAFKTACREHFSEVNDLVFEVCWDFSEQEHHSNGYDEIANGLYDIVDFAARVINVSNGD